MDKDVSSLRTIKEDGYFVSHGGANMHTESKTASCQRWGVVLGKLWPTFNLVLLIYSFKFRSAF